jgi:hypothetical protein
MTSAARQSGTSSLGFNTGTLRWREVDPTLGKVDLLPPISTASGWNFKIILGNGAPGAEPAFVIIEGTVVYFVGTPGALDKLVLAIENMHTVSGYEEP